MAVASAYRLPRHTTVTSSNLVSSALKEIVSVTQQSPIQYTSELQFWHEHRQHAYFTATHRRTDAARIEVQLSAMRLDTRAKAHANLTFPGLPLAWGVHASNAAPRAFISTKHERVVVGFVKYE